MTQPLAAFIPAAGLGTRLRPLTDHCPKPLLTVKGKTLLELVFTRLYQAGIRDFILNIHHLPAQMLGFIGTLRQQYPDCQIHTSDETAQLLDTGGGLKKASQFLRTGQHLLVYNSDIISNIDLGKFWDFHQRGAAASLAVQQRPSSRRFLFDPQNRLIGWENSQTQQQQWANDQPQSDYRPLAFSGIHLLSPQVWAHLPQADIFPLKDWYLHLAAKLHLLAYPHDGDEWTDVGKLPELQKLNQ